jgi:hypothetical protein
VLVRRWLRCPSWCLPHQVVPRVPPSISSSCHAPFLFRFSPLCCAQHHHHPSPLMVLSLITSVCCVVPCGASLMGQYLVSLVLCCIGTVALLLLPQHIKLIVVLLSPPLEPHPAHLVMVHHCAGKKGTCHAQGHFHPFLFNLIVVLTILHPTLPHHGPLLCRSNQTDMRNWPIGSEKGQ